MTWMWTVGESLKKQETKKGRAIFETFSTDGLSEFLVVSRSRWDKHQRKWNAPWRQNASASATDGQWEEGLAESWMEFGGKKGYGGSGKLPGKVRPHEGGH